MIWPLRCAFACDVSSWLVAGAGLARRCWLDQKLVRAVARDSSQICRFGGCSLARAPATGRLDRERENMPAAVMVADDVEVVIGVDTHTDTHTAVVIDRCGGRLAEVSVSADPAGYARLIGWADAYGPRDRLVWAMEGARCHGVGLTRALVAAGQRVIEAPKPPRATARRGGKSDPADTLAAGRAVLAAEHPGSPRADGVREELRTLLVTRRHYTDTRTATINLLKSLILTADEALRERLRGQSTAQQLRALATVTPACAPAGHRERYIELAILADQARSLATTLRENTKRLTAAVTALMPALLAQPGVGPVTAAVLLSTWSHPGRFRNEAAYASLAGVNPIPASSGRTVRHRLNRGGDRTLNAALHTIVNTRWRDDPQTITYVQRRRAQGKTDPEIRRILKRYTARRLYRTMEKNAQAA